MSKESNKGVSDDIIKAYHDRLKETRLSRHSSVSSLETGGEDGPKPLSSLTLLQQNVLNNISKLKQHLLEEATGLETKFIEQFRQYQELRQVIDNERTRLEAVYEIEIAPNDINAIIELRKEKKFALDTEIELKTKQFEEKMAAMKKNWERERELNYQRQQDAEKEFQSLRDHLEKEYSDKRQVYDDQLEAVLKEIEAKEKEADSILSKQEATMNERLEEKQQALETLNQEKQEAFRQLDQDLVDHKNITEKEKEALKLNWELERSEQTLKHKEIIDEIKRQHMREKESLKQALDDVTVSLEKEMNEKNLDLSALRSSRQENNNALERERRDSELRLRDLRQKEQEKIIEEKQNLRQEIEAIKREADTDVKQKRQVLVDKEMQIVKREQDLNEKEAELAKLRFRVSQLEKEKESSYESTLSTARVDAKKDYEKEKQDIQARVSKQSRLKEEALGQLKIKVRDKEQENELLRTKLELSEKKVEQLVSKAVHRFVPVKESKSGSNAQAAFPKIVRSYKS